ncbi:primase-helicase family protein [Comamonas terrae]|uniref:Primase-helicase family protein n=1 Tax=Comamonas terrae TaxID=673548 RepID=A0ABW5UL63_9BURK|nr:primase-helicase family protein [Comamonas terrae]
MKISNMGHAHGRQLVDMWKASEKRRTIRADELVFDPTMKCEDSRLINMCDGMAMVPKKGNVEPMLDLVSFLCSRATPDEPETGDVMHWLLCWLAYPLQHPGAKMRTAVVMHGDEGAGKNMLFETVVQIYGKYATIVGQDELEDKFNDWRSCKQFVVGDEIMSRAELVHNKNRLKALITSPTVQINSKHQIRREEKNHMNIAFLSNELQPLALDNSDRRYLVVYTPKAKEDKYYIDLGGWRDNGGTEAFYQYLLDYPLGDFNPYTKPPMTVAKSNLIDLNLKSAERFWVEWAEGELDLPYQSCAGTQAYRAYLKWCQRTGERYPFNKQLFTSTVVRFSDSRGKAARTKPMNVTRVGEAKKTERMFLVCDPVLGEGEARMTEGQWATDCVKGFEDYLRKYLGYGSGSPAPDAEDSSGNQ